MQVFFINLVRIPLDTISAAMPPNRFKTSRTTQQNWKAVAGLWQTLVDNPGLQNDVL